MIELVIPEATPSLNRLLGQNWSHKHKVRNHWWWLVKAARGAAKAWESPNYLRARLTIERTGGRLLDHENCLAGTKFLTDALVREKFIAGDSPAHIGQPTLRQIIHATLRQTVVRIEAVACPS